MLLSQLAFFTRGDKKAMANGFTKIMFTNISPYFLFLQCSSGMAQWHAKLNCTSELTTTPSVNMYSVLRSYSYIFDIDKGVRAKERWRCFRRPPKKLLLQGFFFFFLIKVLIYHEARSYCLSLNVQNLYTIGGSLYQYTRSKAYKYLECLTPRRPIIRDIY